jgi:hypothetical protein
MVGTIIFLLDSSRQPGHCLNACRLGSEGEWAWDGTTGCHDDFQFLPEQLGFTVLPRNQTPEGIGYNYDTAMSSLVTNVATVTVRCLDYGGWTYLMGYVIGFFGEGAARRIDAPDLFVVDIPVDKNENHIADYWEDLRDPPSRDPLSDDDDTPVGDGRTDGDGLSLYEEYRGLMKQGRWRDFDPWIKDMFVTNFGAVPRDPENGDWSFVIPNEAITSPDGFIGAGMPPLWLLNANEGALRWVRHSDKGFWIPGKIVNFLHGYAHLRDVYAAVVVPSEDNQPELAWTLGPIWDGGLVPVIEINVTEAKNWGRLWGIDELESLTMVIGHELGHTVLWDVDHNPADDSQSFGGDGGHHVIGQDGKVGQHTIHCLMWPYFPPRICPSGYVLCYPRIEYCPDRFLHWEWSDELQDWVPRDVGNWIVVRPTEFCQANPGCQSLWKLNP